MVVDAGDQFQFGAIGQEYRAGDIQLPQLHRRFALPAFVVLAAAFAFACWDQAVARQHPVDGRPGRQWAHLRLAQLKQQPARPPPLVRPAQLAHQRLDLSVQLAGLMSGAVGMVS